MPKAAQRPKKGKKILPSKVPSVFTKWNPFKKGKKIHVISFHGVIQHQAGRSDTIHSHAFLPVISKAFRKGSCEAVALLLNSPGGSPSQAMLISEAIRHHAARSKIPVYAFIEDVAASGGYWIAASADKVYGLPTSIVGSIGVISAGFGFQELIKRYGIERRVHIAGKHKDILDPFQEQRDFDTKHLQSIQLQLHETFIDYVKEQRKALQSKKNNDALFSGLFWLGQESKDKGLIDELGSMKTTMEKIYGEHVRFISFRPKRSLFGPPFRRRLHLGDVLDELDAWALKSRYHL